ncbi:MAG TPA: hypothetical protein VEL74_01195 [Thermoanaerobaculia bacterium]|nr:hypothetical protein [Thermoanaerobaculia bacterium]
MATRRETTKTGILGTWRELLPPLMANAAELPQLEIPRGKLERILGRAQEVVHLQGLLAANRQELTREWDLLQAEGERVAALLRRGIKEHYGPRAEKLAEFGLQPFRGRKAKKVTEAEEPDTPTLS